eukprot:s2924_g5.t1
MTNEGGGAMPMNEDGALTVEDDESPLSQTGVARAASAAALIDREARQDALRDAADAAAALQAALQTTRTHEHVLNPYQQQALQENMGPPPSNPPRKIPPKKKDKSASWVQELRDLLQGGQREMLSEIRAQGQNVAKVSDQVTTLAQQQTTFQSRLDAMETEMRDLRTARSGSPAPHRSGGTGGYTGDVSPRSNAPSSAVNRPVIDDFQLVMGGWSEAKKADIEEEIRLWAARNRSKEERAKIRALVGIKEYCLKYVNQMFIDLDWRGKLWIRSEQVLFFAHTRKPNTDSLMLNDGDESGWWVDLRVLSKVLGKPQDEITRELTE